MNKKIKDLSEEEVVMIINDLLNIENNLTLKNEKILDVLLNMDDITIKKIGKNKYLAISLDVECSDISLLMSLAKLWLIKKYGDYLNNKDCGKSKIKI